MPQQTEPRQASPLAARDPALGPPGYWYVACASRALGPAPLPVRVAGVELTLRRDPEGTITASDGRRVIEAQHYLWVYLGDGDGTVDGPKPYPLFDRKRRAFVQRTVSVASDYRLMLENSLDLAHSSFVHPFTQPTWLLHRVGLGRAVMDVTYWPTHEGLEVEGRLGTRLVFRQAFALPDRMRLWVMPDTPFEVEVTVYHVPETARTCRLEVAISRPALPWESSRPRWAPRPLLIHRQDLRIVEAQQRALDEGPSLPERHCEADAYTLLLRRVLAAACEGGWGAGDAAPRTVRIRV